MSNLSSWPERTGANELRTQILQRLYSAFYKVSVVLIARTGDDISLHVAKRPTKSLTSLNLESCCFVLIT